MLPTALVAEDYKFLNNYHIFKIRGGREDETEKRGKKYLLCNKYQDKRFQQLTIVQKTIDFNLKNYKRFKILRKKCRFLNVQTSKIIICCHISELMASSQLRNQQANYNDEEGLLHEITKRHRQVIVKEIYDC